MSNDPRPQVEITYGEKGPPPPIADLTRTGAVFGPCSAGPLNTLTTLTTEADLVQFGHGPGVVAAYDLLKQGGAPQYFSRSATSTPGSSGSVTRTAGPSSVGTPTAIGANNNRVTYTANQLGVTFARVVSGSLTALSVVVTGKAIVVNSATDNGGAATTTGAQELAAVLASAAAMALLAAAALTQGSDGSAVLGAVAATSLPFGSAGSFSITTSAAFDQHEIVVQVLRGGTVGTDPYPTFRWSADGGDAAYKKSIGDTSTGGSWSGEIVIPPGGILQLKDLTLDTGVVVTLSGAFLAGDTFRFSTVAPVTSQSDTLTAMDQALPDLTRAFSFALVVSPSDSSAVVAYNDKLQTVKAFPLYRAVRAFCGVRDIDFAGAETEDQWGTAIVDAFDGATPVTSAQGRIVLFGGHCRHYSGYTGRYTWRSLSLPAAARRAARAVHEDLGKVGQIPSPIANVVQLRHDESLKLIFSGHRITSAMTHAGIGLFFTRTLALAPQGSRYGRQPIASVMDQVALIARTIALRYLLDTEVADETGAIAIEVANSMEDVIGAEIATYLYKPKEDGKVSASPVPSGNKLVTVRRDYNFTQENELRLVINVWHVGYNDKVSIDLNVVTPGS